MRIHRIIGIGAVWCFVGLGTGQGAPLSRAANLTLTNLPAAPPNLNFTATNAFPNLAFTNPVGIYSPPGETNRLFVLEKRGRIVVITNLAAPTRALFMDLTSRVIGSDTDVAGEEGLLGFAFHPGFATNGYCYAYYTGNDNTGSGTTRHDILSRFSVDPANPNQGLPASESKILRQRDEASNHNAGEIRFGADGYLYLSLGDEGGGDNTYANAQRIDKDFFSGILRLEVDKRPGNLPPNAHVSATTNYLVPADNPFVGATSFNGISVTPTQVRTEFWAVGLRNPWRMSFDPLTGDLYCADVGQNTIEELDLIAKGNNYGWAYWEGNFRRTNQVNIPAGFVHTLPLIDYGRTNGYAIVGGLVYRGSRISQLYGAYVYGDYGSGRIWALTRSGNTVLTNRLLLTDDANNSGPSGLSAFGSDPSNGDILCADEQNGSDGKIKRIVPTTTTGKVIPASLDLVGAFGNLTNLTPNPGVVAYDVSLPFWSDGAIKSRWFAVPNTNLTITFSREGNWLFPTGTVWIKHFELELTNGVPASRKRIETRVLVKNGTGGYGATYRWGDSLTNATLVPDEGLEESFTIQDGGNTTRTQVWHYPSRAECLQCHTALAGFALGFNTPQLNRDFDYGGVVTNQVAALSQAGYFNTNVTGIHALRTLAAAGDATASLESRVRSYLAANCVQCHQPGGVAQANWDARLTTPTDSAGLVNGSLFNNLGDAANRVLAPGLLSKSVLLSRISIRGPGQMPPLASTVVDTEDVALVASWVTNDLPGFQTFADWQLQWFGGTNLLVAGAQADPDGDGAINELEFLTGSNPTNALETWRISFSLSNGLAAISYPQIANRGFELQTAAPLPLAPWTPLDVPQNAPRFSASNQPMVILDPAGLDASRYYRVRVFRP